MTKRKTSRSGVPLGIYPLEPVPGAPPAAFEMTADDIFVLLDGRRVAKRGKPNTPHARTWVSLEPGVIVFDDADPTTIAITIDGVRVH